MKLFEWQEWSVEEIMEKAWKCFDNLGYKKGCIKKGDVFVYRPSVLKRYYYGIVVDIHEEHVLSSYFYKLLHLQFFDYSTVKIEESPKLSKTSLLFPPILIRCTDKTDAKRNIMESPWPEEYFQIVGNTNLCSLESVKRAMFVDLSGWLYTDAGEAVGYEQTEASDAYCYMGEFSAGSEKKLEDFICYALNLPLNRKYTIGETPLWYIDSFKDRLSEFLERQEKASALCTRDNIPLQVPYKSDSITQTLTQERAETNWVEYVRQCGPAHYAVIQFHIEPINSEHAILFKNEAIIDVAYKGNRHLERMFQTFVFLICEGIQAVADIQYRERGIAIGGIQISLLQLKFHESDSGFTDFKIVGSMLLLKYFPNTKE